MASTSGWSNLQFLLQVTESISGCIVSLVMFKESNYIQYIFVLLGKFRGLIGPFEMNQSPCYYKTKDYKSIELGNQLILDMFNTVDKLLHRTQLSESKMHSASNTVLANSPCAAC